MGFVNAGRGNATTQAAQYLITLPAPMPDGVLALSDDATATSFGGYVADRRKFQESCGM